ncbi:DNA recombination protein RmuC [Polaribacter tangerinus]|uniref:DNA recombination protein RmuC n=1 Tax=Polaribacter tangerinus TaxID=1920034 RepID=UPI000B4A81C4|nr:DNA recombination protein RmuC [Polaribacter tangerinus]
MTDFLSYLLIAFIFVVIGLFVGRLLAKSALQKEKLTLEKENSSLNASVIMLEQAKDMANNNLISCQKELRNTQLEKEALISEKTRLETEFKNTAIKLNENKKELDKLNTKYLKEFENLATKILEDNSTKFKNQNKESISAILNPLKEKIEGFEKKVSESQEKSVGMHAALKEQLGSLKQLNLQMSKEAINLTKALKGDNKTQGDWGETQLEILLEKAKLTKEIHFTTQGGYRDSAGKLKKPDFVINLPENRHLIIDAKVSLTAYENYFSSENEIEKEKYLKSHIESIRSHFKDLSDKKYEDLYEINSPDYVLMFVPIEPALMIALNKVNNLYLEALDKNIVLVSTSTLLATLSTVSSMWRQENQKRNVLEISKQAAALYDQFVNLTDDLLKVGSQLKTVQGSYDSSMKKLTGSRNLIKKVEKIKQLGINTSKKINQKLLDNTEDEA